jgi:hypothetical protein
MKAFQAMQTGLTVLKVLVLVVVAVVVSGCATTGYRKVDVTPMNYQPLTSDKEIRVYIKPYKYDTCTGGAIAIWRYCGKGEISDFIRPALIASNIPIAGTEQDGNVVIKTLDVEYGRHTTGFKATTTFLINNYTIKIVAKVYDENFWHVFNKDGENALYVTAEILAKLVKNNIGGDHEITAKILQKDDKIVKYSDSTGL